MEEVMIEEEENLTFATPRDIVQGSLCGKKRLRESMSPDKGYIEDGRNHEGHSKRLQLNLSSCSSSNAEELDPKS
jgi:hypothetical protein